MKNVRFLSKVTLTACLGACLGLNSHAQTFEGKSADPEGWETVWYDHFEGDKLNTNLWNIEVNGDGGGNQELQYYCEKGVKVEGGNLVLTATRENYEGKNFTSGRITTQNKVYFKHGKIEARIKIPKTHQGLWPAFWMMGNDISSKGWPACGEIDILEMGHSNGWANGDVSDRFFNGAFHWGPGIHAWTAQDYTAKYSIQDGEYHLFTCEWNGDEMFMYLDGDRDHPYCRMTTPSTPEDYANEWAPVNYFHKPNFILFNLAVGGTFPGIFNAQGITAIGKENGSSASMYVDWVRVVQPKDGDYTLEVPFKDGMFDTTTGLGSFGTKALDDNGNSTFDFDHSGDYVLISTSDEVTKKFAGKIKANYNPDDTQHFMYIWENTFYPYEYNAINSFGFNEKVTTYNVGNIGWSGLGYSSSEPGKDLSMLDDDYIFHFAVKGSDVIDHIGYGIGVGEAKFALSAFTDAGNVLKVLGDFPRDDQWYSFDIPLKVLRESFADPIFPNSEAFKDNAVFFLAGGKQNTSLTFDNIFFYKNNKITDSDIIDNTPCGEYVSKALENSVSTFDDNNSDKIIPVLLSGNVRNKFSNKIREGYDVDKTGVIMQIWEDEWGNGPTMSDAGGSGVNSFGFNENFTSLKVNSLGWSRCAFNFTDVINNGIDMSVLDKENYYLHLGIKDSDPLDHTPYVFEINGQFLTLGLSGNGYLTDFTRDGNWYYVDIPISAIGKNIFNSVTGTNLITINAGALEGTKLEFDNIFFYIKSENNQEPLDPDPKDPDDDVNFEGASKDEDGWETVWYDHFNGNELNKDNWNIELRDVSSVDSSVTNGELQSYTEDAVTVENGNLVITASRSGNQGNYSFTSGRINTQEKVYFNHGKVEARMILPKTANGLWPAFWMLGADFRTDENWPMCGEVDIMEAGSREGIRNEKQEYFFGGCLHWNPGRPSQYVSQTFDEVQIEDGNYHVFTCIWDEKAINMYVDGKHYYEYDITKSTDPYSAGKYFHHPFHLLFNLAVGGSDFTGIGYGNDVTALNDANNGKAQMLVDWVRISQPKDNPHYTFLGEIKDDECKIGGNEKEEDENLESVNIPAVPVPVHTVDEHDVTSVFSSHYDSATKVVIGNWGQTTIPTRVKALGQNNQEKVIYKLENFNYLGFELSPAINIEDMTHMHVDYYSPTGTTFSFTPIAIPAERYWDSGSDVGESHWQAHNREHNPEGFKTGAWNSFDVPLKHFKNEYNVRDDNAAENPNKIKSTTTVKNIYQIKFTDGGNTTGYLANVYFYYDPAALDDNGDDNGGDNGGGDSGATGDGCTYIDGQNTDTGSTTTFNGLYTINVKTVNNNDVLITVTFSKEDIDRTGWVNPILWDETAGGIVEKDMTSVGNGTYTCTLTGLSSNSTIKFRIKAVFAGMAVTREITYTVGQNCNSITTAVENVNEDLVTRVYPNPADDVWNVESNVQYGEISLWSLDGSLGGRYELVDGEAQIDAKPFAPGIYIMRISSYNGNATHRLIKK